MLLWVSHAAHVPEISEAFQMRLNQEEFKGGFHTRNLHYLSIWWLNNQNFGVARLTRDLTDAWIAQKWDLGGVRYTNESPELSQSELDQIPGARAAMGSLDELKWEVLERCGDSMIIKKDEDKYWSMQEGTIGETYAALKEHHNQLIGRLTTVNSQREAQEVATQNDGSGTAPEESAECTLESSAKLEENHGIETKVVSEVGGIELVLCKDKSVWLLASQDKTVGKHTVVGGFGTGQWVAESDAPEQSIGISIAQGDQTKVQLDEASFSAEQQGITTLSLYKLLVRAEQEKGITQHKLSFLSVERKGDQNIEAGGDAFDIRIKTAMAFKCVRDARPGQDDKTTCKNFFSRATSSAKESKHLSVVHRFRFERVGQSFKIQRPYVMLTNSVTLKKGVPLKVSKWHFV